MKEYMIPRCLKWKRRRAVCSAVAVLFLLLSGACMAPTPATPVPVRGPWEQVTTAGLPYGIDEPSFAAAPDGTLYLAWTDRSGDGSQIRVQALQGKLWKEVGAVSAGGVSNASGLGAMNPSIAVAPDGTPYVAWRNVEQREMGEIHIRAWNGSDWGEVGGGSASDGGISNIAGDSRYPAIAIASNGTPYVVWTEHNGSTHRDSVYVRAWDGNNWVEVGPHSATGGGINHSGAGNWASIAIAPDHTPYVAWTDEGSQKDIHIRNWDGRDWVEVGAGSASGGGVSNTGEAGTSSLAIAPDGRPYIAWENVHEADHEIYVQRWDGNRWIEVGKGSASNGGVSSTGHATGPAMAVAGSGIPYAAWVNDGEFMVDEIDNPNGPPKLYIRAWDGSTWSEVGTGSASGDGLGRASFVWPLMAVAPDGTLYLVWNGPSGLTILRHTGN